MPVDDPSKFADRFSIESSRLKNWDYSSPGIYFVTICTLTHNKFFGKIIENKMCLSLRGQIAQQCIVDIPKHFLNVKILDYVVMPNHLHILMETIPLQLKSVETHDRASLQTPPTSLHKKYQSFHFHRLAIKSNQTIPKIVSQFKSSVTRMCNQHSMFFAWQSRFHDEIVKDDQQLIITKQYIRNNVANWEKDKFYR